MFQLTMVSPFTVFSLFTSLDLLLSCSEFVVAGEGVESGSGMTVVDSSSFPFDLPFLDNFFLTVACFLKYQVHKINYIY